MLEDKDIDHPDVLKVKHEIEKSLEIESAGGRYLGYITDLVLIPETSRSISVQRALGGRGNPKL